MQENQVMTTHHAEPAKPYTPPRPLVSDELFQVALEDMAAMAVFADVDTWDIAANPWRRPVRPQSFKYFKFGPATAENHLDYGNFTTNRMLTALNEIDFLFLPDKNLEPAASYEQFY